MSNAPIFIGGMFKSGTTLLRAMLEQHSQVASGLETYWFNYDWNDKSCEKMEENYKKLSVFFEMPSKDLKALAETAHTPENFLDTLMGKVVVSSGKPRWAEKTPGNIANVDRIWKAWPDAQVLHIVRDPRDVYASLVEAKKWLDPDEFADRWILTIGNGEKLVEELKPTDKQYLRLRYEDLILNVENTMREVLDFLDLKWEERVAHFEGKADDFDKVLKATGKASTTLERLKGALTDSRVGLHKRVLSEDQIAAIEKAITDKGYGQFYQNALCTE